MLRMQQLIYFLLIQFEGAVRKSFCYIWMNLKFKLTIYRKKCISRQPLRRVLISKPYILFSGSIDTVSDYVSAYILQIEFQISSLTGIPSSMFSLLLLTVDSPGYRTCPPSWSGTEDRISSSVSAISASAAFGS